MKGRTMTLIIVAVLVIAGLAAAVYYVSQDDGSDPVNGSIELPPADGAGGVPTDTVQPGSEESVSGVDPSLTVDDPVPDAVVSELFGVIEAQGDRPTMNAEYTVQFVEDTNHVRLSGTFENGEATYYFEFDDGAWKLASEDD